jgi:putrescine transport system substrate-binding protein
MIRRVTLTAALALIAITDARADEKVVNVYNWTELIGSRTVEEFTKETGIKVVYDTYDSDETLEAKLMAGSSGYDIVVPSSTFLPHEVMAGVLQKLDKSKIPNWSNQDPALLKLLAVADPNNEHAAVYDWGSTGLIVNVDEVEKRLPGVTFDSYDLLFKPENAAKLQDCGITVLDSPADVVPITLKYLGLSPDSENPADLEQAQKTLMAIRPYLKYIHSSRYLSDLATGEICLAIGWSGDASIAQRRATEANNGVHLKYFTPKEGGLTWFGAIAIPLDAPHPDEAHAFINYILKPSVAADFTNTVGYGNGVPASLPLVDPGIANDPTIFPPEEEKKRLFFVPASSADYDRLRTRAWTTFKTGV